MIRLKEYPAETLERYYRRLCEHLEMIMLWRGLQYKAEAGSTRSEKGYQTIAKSIAKSMAHALGCNEYKAEALCVCVGCGFPLYGAEGMAVIRQYATEHLPSLNPSFLEGAAVEDYISSRLFVATDLDALLKEYYLKDPTEPPSCPELAVVRLCQSTIRKIKLAERYGNAEGGELLYTASQELVAGSKAAGKPVAWEELDRLVSSLSITPKEQLTEAQKDEIRQALDGYLKAFGEEGVYKYITSHEL